MQPSRSGSVRPVPSLEVEVLSGTTIVGRAPLGAQHPLVGVDAHGRLVTGAADGRPARLWIATRGPLVCAMSVDPLCPATIGGAPLPGTWVPLGLPCAVHVGAAVVNVRAASHPADAEEVTRIGAIASRPSSARAAAAPPAQPSDETWVEEAPSGVTRVALPSAPVQAAKRVPPSSSSGSIPALVRSAPPPPPPSTRPPSQARTLRLVALAGIAAAAGLWLIGMNTGVITTNMSRRTQTTSRTASATTPAETTTSSAAADPPAAPVAKADAGAPRLFDEPDEASAEPSEAAVAAANGADRRIAEAMFAGDYQRALDESAALGKADPTSARYAVIARVLRAKAARMPAR